MHKTNTDRYKQASVAEATARQVHFDAFLTHCHHELDRVHRRELAALVETLRVFFTEGQPLEPVAAIDLASRVYVDPTQIWVSAMLIQRTMKEMAKQGVRYRLESGDVIWQTVQTHAEAALAAIHTAQRRATQASREEIR